MHFSVSVDSGLDRHQSELRIRIAMLVALEFIDKSVSIRSLLRFVRPLRHPVLVQEDQVIDGC